MSAAADDAGAGSPRRGGTSGAGRPGAVPAAGVAGSAARRAVTFARLAWFTALRLFVNPFVLAGVLLSVFLIHFTVAPTATLTRPDLYDGAVLSALAVALGLFGAVTFPALREARYGRDPVGPLGRVGRYLAVGAGAALVGWTCLAGLLASSTWGLPADLPGLVAPLSHLTPFVVVLLGPAASMALVAWTRSYAPLLLIALLVPTYGLYSITAFDTAQSVERVVARVQSLAFMAVDPFPIHSPSVPALVHLYLAYTALLVVGLAVLAVAARRRGAVRAVALGASVALLLSAGGTAAHGVSTYTWGSPVPDRLLHGADTVSCRTRDGITYCPLPGYESWVDDWHAVVGPALAALPEEAADDLPVVWQDSTRFDRDPAGMPSARVVVYDVRYADEPWWRLDMLDGTARALFDLEPLWETRCRAGGQSRLLLAAWMAGLDRSGDDADGLGRTAVLLSEYGPYQRDLEVVGALLSLPEGEVFAVLHDHWELLSSPAGRTEDLAGFLGLPVRGSAHASPTSADWDRLFPGMEMGYYTGENSETVCA